MSPELASKLQMLEERLSQTQKKVQEYKSNCDHVRSIMCSNPELIDDKICAKLIDINKNVLTPQKERFQDLDREIETCVQCTKIRLE
jgi:tRNA(Phe) wybutosine-synthesizing methylase Tyw3